MYEILQINPDWLEIEIIFFQHIKFPPLESTLKKITEASSKTLNPP